MIHYLSCSDLSLLDSLPDALNDPFDYRPSALMVRGRELLLAALAALPNGASVLGELSGGKMLGALLVEDLDGGVGFLFGFSGLVCGVGDLSGFVPAIYDMRGGDFSSAEAAISAVSAAVAAAELSGDDLLVRSLRAERSALSQALQRRIFDSYVVVNGFGDLRSMSAIFEDRYGRLPPSGAGECAAPKLLHYALSRGLRPLEVGEFWYGSSSRGEVRHDGEFYGACLGKCKPILEFMLQGVSVAAVASELRRDLFRRCDLAAIYDSVLPLYVCDDYIVYDKPAGMLSVRGLDGDVISLEELAQLRCPDARVVHRLDQATSGVIVFACGLESQVVLQRQFEDRSVAKGYVALVEGFVGAVGLRGVVEVPLVSDFENRPRQRVDFECGKPCRTSYRVVSHERMLSRDCGLGRPVTRLDLKPHTGRTHQLRLHCAYPSSPCSSSVLGGLGAPIVGDPLYGFADSYESVGRMCLHASLLSFDDPFCGRRVSYSSPAPF